MSNVSCFLLLEREVLISNPTCHLFSVWHWVTLQTSWLGAGLGKSDTSNSALVSRQAFGTYNLSLHSLVYLSITKVSYCVTLTGSAQKAGMRIAWDNCGKKAGLATNVEWLWMIMLFLFSAVFLVTFGFPLWTLPSDFAFSLSFPGTCLLPSLLHQDSAGTFCWLVLQHLSSLPTLSCRSWKCPCSRSRLSL